MANSPGTKRIPETLKQMPRWICWRAVTKDGKTTKQPLYITENGGLKSTGYNSPSNWRTFAQIEQTPYGHGALGVGVHFKDMDKTTDPIIAIDLDDCRDPETGVITTAAMAYVHKLNSYTEVSPSGTGLRIFVYGRLPGNARSKDTKEHHVELFYKSGWVTVTGDHIDNTPRTIERRQDELVWLYNTVFPHWAENRLKLHNSIFRSADKQRALAVELLEGLDPVRVDDYWDWVTVGMALKSVADDDEMRTAWDNWSQESDKYPGVRAILDKWASFRGDGITLGTLIAMAREDGFSPKPGGQSRPAAADTDPLDAAVDLAEECRQNGGFRTVLFRGVPYVWRGGRFVAQEPQQWMTEIGYQIGERYYGAGPAFLATVRSHFRRLITLPDEIQVGDFLEGHEGPVWQRHECLATPTAIVHLPTGETQPAVPTYFGTSVVDCSYQAHHPMPYIWLDYLDEIFGHLDEVERASNIRLLQQWFGYCLSPDCSRQRLFLLLGPSRSGKGTIAAVLTHLLGGSASVAGSHVADLAGRWGLGNIVDKRLVIFGDARGGDSLDRGSLIEKVLSITGQDQMMVERKFLPSTSMAVPVKLMFVSNEMPTLLDDSGALLNRYLVVTTERDFVGREDPTVLTRLLQDLPQILCWAIDGWRDLQARGEFVRTQAMEAEIELESETTRPMRQFVLDCLEPGSEDDELTNADLYDIYRTWAEWNRLRPLNRLSFFRRVRPHLKFATFARSSGGTRTRVVQRVRPKKVEEF